MYYLHLSDIHIRPLERHNEYLQVFDNLFNYIRNNYNKEEVIVFVCGDICHIRDKLLSETIIILDYFISGLSQLAHSVYIINGNHDIYKSSNRLDILYGIDKIKMWDNVVFLRNSQILSTTYFNLVYSALNDKFITYSDYLQSEYYSTSKQSIYLYHGIVHSDNSNFCGNVYKTQSEFSGFDLILLGDLHEYHLIGNNIGYCGSLIQQNFKESNKKGMLEWQYTESTTKWVSKFIPISNNYSFITINIEEEDLNQKIITSKINSTQFTEYSRIRLLLNINPKDFTTNYEEYIKELIKQKTNIISFTKQFKSLIEKITNTDTCTKNESISEIDIINKLLGTLNYSDYAESILNLHNKYKTELNIQDTNYSKTWTITELEFKNVFIYGNDITNKITFTKEIIGILGNNAIGKSCILYIIIYALFGVITKSKNVENRSILNKDAKNYFIKLTIDIDNIKYIITRANKQTKITKKSGITFNELLTFSKVENNTITELTCATKTDTELLIKTTLGITSKDDFIFTNIISNILYKNVLTMTNSELQEVLSNMFNTKIYKEIGLAVKKDIKTLETQLANLNGQLHTFNSISEYENTTIDTSIKNTLSKRKKEIESILKSIDNLKWDLDIINLAEDWTTLDSKLKVIIEQKNNIENRCNFDSKMNKESLLLELNKYHSIINELKGNYTINRPESFDNSLDYHELIDNLMEYISKESEIQVKNNLLMKNTASFKNNIKKYNSALDITINDFETIKEYFSDLYSNSKQFINYSESNLITKAKVKVKEYYYCLQYSNYLKLLELNEMSNLIKQKLQYLELVKSIENITKAYNYLEVKNKYNELNSELHTITKQLIGIDLTIEKNKYNKEQVNSIKEKITIISKEVKVLEIYKNIVSEKHLQKLLIYDTINLLQNEVNMIIYTLSNITIDFEITDNYKWNILIHKGGMVLGPEQCSGYERFIINTCLKIVFDKYKFYSGIKMFFIDEGLDCVSVENYHKIDELFKLLKSYYHTVMIISHNDDLKQKVESNIKINYTGKYSYLE